MPRAKNAKADEALALYRQGLKLIDIAKRLDLPEGTVRRWKCTYKWEANARKKPKKASARKRGGQKGNKNAVGNTSSKPGNQKAAKFGFYSKYLPDETLEIFEALDDADPLDILWDQIRISYTAIVRAQRIAYVKDQADKTIAVTMESVTDSGSSTAYDVQQAWDKQTAFMKAQAQAMSTLNGLIKQYNEMLRSRGEEATEEQKLRLDLMRAKLGQGAEEVKKVTIINDTRDQDQ